MILRRTRYKEVKPISIVEGGKVGDPSITSNNTNINTNFTELFNQSISNIKKSILKNAPKTNTKGNISMNDVDDFIRVLYLLSKNSESILNETDVWDVSESKLLEFISHPTAKLFLLTNKIKRAYEKWSIINLEKRTDDGQGPMGISSDTNKSGVNTELYNQFDNYDNLSKNTYNFKFMCMFR